MERVAVVVVLRSRDMLCWVQRVGTTTQIAVVVVVVVVRFGGLLGG